MRTPRTLVLALTSVFAMAFTPALAADQPKSEQVEIEVDLEASLEDKIRSIRAQAWDACSPTSSIYASARNAVRRECQKQVVEDVLAQLSVEQGLQLAETE